MSRQPWGTRRLLAAYSLALASAFLVSILLAALGDSWKHHSGNPALLLLPISNIRFWFLPFGAAACAGAASAGGRPTGDLLFSTGILSLACVWSAIFWYRAGLTAGSEWTAARVSLVIAERGLSQLAGGSLSLLGIALFSMAVVRSFRQSDPQSHDAG